MNKKNTSKHCTIDSEGYWIQQGIPGIGFGTSNINLNEDFLRSDPDPEELRKTVKIFRDRERLKHHSLVTAVIDDEDFQPLSFLRMGAEKGVTVCRIARYFSHQSFQEFIEKLKQAIDKWGTAHTFNTAAKLKEIFSIPNSVAQQIFSLPDSTENSNLWFEERNDLIDTLKNLTDSQLIQINPIPIGTGFLVGEKHLLTNWHVLPDAEIAEQCVAQFNYEDVYDYTQSPIDYEFDSRVFFVSEPRLDYTLVQLRSGMFTRPAGYHFGWIQLIEDDAAICPGLLYLRCEETNTGAFKNSLFPGLQNSLDFLLDEVPSLRNQDWYPDNLWKIEQGKIVQKNVFFMNVKTKAEWQLVQKVSDWKGALSLPNHYYSLEGEESGDLVFIIQHPKGRRKQISVGDNKVLDYGLFKDFLRYRTDTDYGSSGSPVFNSRWQLVALHHAAIPRITSTNGAKKYSKEESQPTEIVAQQGIRICRIIEDLKQKGGDNSKLKSFIEDFVVTSEELNYPPLPAALEFDGEKSYVDCGRDKSLEINQAITIEAWIKNNDLNSDGFIVYQGGNFDKPGYCIWRYAKKIRVELQDNSYPSKRIIVDTDNMVLNDQDWHHIAFTWDKNDLAKDPQKDENISTKIAGITIFIDGEIQPIVSVLLNDISNFGDINNPKESLTIGRSENIEETIDKLLKEFKNDSFFEGHFKRPNTNLRLTIARQYYFNGSITEVRLWNVARTQEQIKRNMYRRLSEQDSKLSRQDQYWSKLVGYWRLEEAVDNKAYNLKSENLPYPTLSSRFNPLNFGLRLHGLVEYVDCGKLNYGKEITALTVEAWVRNMGRESDGMIVHQGGGWSEDGFSIWRCRGNLRVELQNGQNNQKIIVDTKNLVLTDSSPQWHHVAFTWKEYSEIIVYVDGKKEETTVVLSENCKSALEFSNIGIPKVNLNLGRSQNNGRYFNGCIAEVRIWNVAREEDQIQKNMDCQFNANVLKSLPELIGYWPLDQEDGDKATNPVSNDQYGTVFGRRWEKAYTLLEENKGAYGLISKSQIIKGSQYPASRLPFGLMFNEISHYIKCNFQDGENKVIDGITVEAWIKHKFGNCSIVKRSDDHQYEYSLDWYEGKIRVKLQANSEKVVVYTEECFPNDHLWHHVAFTWGKDNQAKNSHEISIYVDGRLQNCIVEGSCKTIISTMQARSIGLFEGSLKIPEKQDISLIIGCKEQGTDYYDIVIAEVRLWNVARTQDQIHKYMSRRLSRQDSEQDWSNLVGYWRLDEISEDGTLAFDQSHSHNHGTVVGATRFPALPSDAAQPPESAGFIESE